MYTKSLILGNFTDYYTDKFGVIQPLESLDEVNDINIFIGTNNSGKSRFMRKLIKMSDFLFLNDCLYQKSQDELRNYNSYRSQEIKLPKSPDFKHLFDFIRSNHNLFRSISYQNLVTTISSPQKIYIPTFRIAHSLFTHKQDEKGSTISRKIEEDILKNTVVQYYSDLSEHNAPYVDIFTGMHLHKDILNTRNAKRERRIMFQEYENFISENFFSGKTVDIIAEFDKDRSQQGDNTQEIISIHIEGEKESRDLYELGDGIQALIILLYKIFMAEENTFVFIDEPEINLHPGMQRLFLNQIINNPVLKQKNLRYFISTHSNHFLDLTLEYDKVSIYSFSSRVEEDQTKKLIVRNVNRGDNKLLKDLGVNNSSVFMANCSIWVEGISDRNYIKAFLKSYCNYFGEQYPREDIDFVFFEYAGSNVDHYFFTDNVDEEKQRDLMATDIKALALSNRIFLLADSDDAQVGSAKHRRLKQLLDAESDNFIPTILHRYREIENLLTTEVWKITLIRFCNKKIVEKLGKDVVQQKIDEALDKIDVKTYRKKYIGEMLNDLRDIIGKDRKTFILNESEYEKSGTLKNKRSLSEFLLSENISWEVYRQNSDIVKLTEDIYKFITAK